MESLLTLEEIDVLEMGLPKALVKVMFKKASTLSLGAIPPQNQDLDVPSVSLETTGNEQNDE